MAEQDERGALSVAHQEGHKSGVEEGQRSGLAEGKVAGVAEAVLAVLAARHLAVDETTRAKILGCSNAATLGRWLAQAVTAGSVEEVLS